MKRFTFVLHDETVNTYGFRMLTSGANLEEFRKNPVILLNHKDWELPIGRWVPMPHETLFPNYSMFLQLTLRARFKIGSLPICCAKYICKCTL